MALAPPVLWRPKNPGAPHSCSCRLIPGSPGSTSNQPRGAHPTPKAHASYKVIDAATARVPRSSKLPPGPRGSGLPRTRFTPPQGVTTREALVTQVTWELAKRRLSPGHAWSGGAVRPRLDPGSPVQWKTKCESSGSCKPGTLSPPLETTLESVPFVIWGLALKKKKKSTFNGMPSKTCTA